MKETQDEVSGQDMTSEQRAIIQEEDRYRRMFAEERESSQLDDPHLLLLDVFDQSEEQWKFKEETAEEKMVPHLLNHWRKAEPVEFEKRAIVATQKEFEKNFDEFTGGMFKGMDWSNVIVAGGAVLANVLGRESIQSKYKDSDIDMFVYGLTDEEANEKLKHIHSVVTKNAKGDGGVIRTRRTVTLLNTYPYRHAQVILKIYKSPAEILLGFDVDCCCFGYDGKKVWAMERSRRSVVKRYNLVNKTRRSATYEKRLIKYAKRCFSVVVPKLKPDELDDQLFYKKPWEVHGLGKLVLYDYRSSHPELFSIQSWREKDGPESDYSGDLDIPWGPGWNSSYILEKLNAQDKSQFFAHKFRVARSTAQAAKLREQRAAGPREDEVYLSDPAAKPPDHRHLFVTGIDQVISGGHFWCDFCNEKMQMLPDGEKLDDPAWKNFVPKKVIWIRKSPAYQDSDNGFRRRLITGSFNPILDEEWDKNCYLPAGRTRGTLPHEQRDLPPNIKVMKTAEWVPRISPQALPPKIDPSELSGGPEELSISDIAGKELTASNICAICNASFYSMNQLRKHVRLSGHIPAQEASAESITPTSLEEACQPNTLLNMDNKTRALLLVSLAFKAGRITSDERATLKESFVRDDAILDSAVQVFIMDRDVDELVDTLKSIVKNLK
eukprot:TRINITY_DN10390_c0_g1_i2.p1 TRINITY_DN10390_c0_g1~~TRINITY_DN10390_c0_g1_i2.p1  ORF type:complete len:665 (-),score=119.73 TRINITY_DN10390_c0_g1_i2:35-2029(-)